MHFSEFLESKPPGSTGQIDDLFGPAMSHTAHQMISRTLAPPVKIHCPSDICNDARIFRCDNAITLYVDIDQETNIIEESAYTAKGLLVYQCGNCNNCEKIYALVVSSGVPSKVRGYGGTAIKIGEWPPFGAPVPSRLITLIRTDRDLFVKGRRCENQGLGVGAFAYYRQVVEGQKGRLISAVADVARRLNAESGVISLLETAAKERQFSKAVESVKDAIPSPLLLKGHNPLTLLHDALSEGIHAGGDDECLALAKDIRIILTELSERIAAVLKDEAELEQALSNLLNRGRKAPSQGGETFGTS
jgi:hypothetical protein